MKGKESKVHPMPPFSQFQMKVMIYPILRDRSIIEKMVKMRSSEDTERDIHIYDWKDEQNKSGINVNEWKCE